MLMPFCPPEQANIMHTCAYLSRQNNEQVRCYTENLGGWSPGLFRELRAPK